MENEELYIKDEEYMREAMRLASAAADIDEVPVGALIVKDGEIIASAHNLRETNKCATAHAELLAIEEACRRLGGWRLPGATLYVTLEPCAMCAGAIINSRIERVVFGASDIRFGALGSLIDLSEIGLNHKPEVRRGVLLDETKNLLSAYFKGKRAKKESTQRCAAGTANEGAAPEENITVDN
ncbi:MAG: tRNA adenosine(34) deaminase TadA [Clostridia bacterium]|nr:tRNA adenosine(34) deaminase TadA [Clostridia bacterium]